MKNKRWVVPLAVIIVIAVFWFSGVIPKQIAKIAGTSYVKEHFPQMKLECTGVEWADAFGDYLISFKGEDKKTYSCVIGPKFFPISLGQGLFAIQSDYEENKLIYGSAHTPDAESSEYAVRGEGGALD